MLRAKRDMRSAHPRQKSKQKGRQEPRIPSGRIQSRSPGALPDKTSIRRALSNPGIATPADILALQQIAGNRSVRRLVARHQNGPNGVGKNNQKIGRLSGSPKPQAIQTDLATKDQSTITLPAEQFEHPIRSAARRGPVRFRLPTFSELESVYKSATLKVPEKVIKDRIATVLKRMKKEKRLKSKDSIPTIIGKIFPGPGLIDEAEYKKVVDVSDRSLVYKTVKEAEAKVKNADKTKLLSTMKEAVKLIEKCESDATNLKLVFGSKKSDAKTRYGKTKTALKDLITNIDTHVTTDYNLDDPEVGLGGWAQFATQKVHLDPDVVKVKDAKEAKVTIIHEAAHLGDPNVNDHIYYSTRGFEAVSETVKINNAAHYEEIARRKLGTSRFVAGFKFKPGTTAAGAPETVEEKVRRSAQNFFRKAWDKAVDVHMFFRAVRKEILAGVTATFNSKKSKILGMSKLMNLTVHKQKAAHRTITQLDVVLTEGIARGAALIQSFVKKPAEIKPPTSAKKKAARKKLIGDAIKGYGVLLGNFSKEKKLLKWLVKKYQQAI